MTELTRVLVVDDHPIVLDGVTLAVQTTTWLQIAGYARTGRDAIEAVDRLRPDIVLLDLRLPDMLAPEAITDMLTRAPATRIVLFTAYPDHAACQAALSAGAHGLLVKDIERTDLVDVIRRVITGEHVISADTTGDRDLVANQKLRAHGLTRREYDILRRVAMGETNPQIATALGLRPNTVKTYLQRTLEKLGAHNRIEALTRANQLGIL